VVDELMERVELPVPPEERVTLWGFRERLRPEGELFAESETVPVKPLRLVNVTVELDPPPCGNVTDEGFADTEKLGPTDTVVKNSVIGLAFASLDVSVAKFQFTSIVLVSE